MMEIMCEETKRIDDGKHTAQICAVEYRDKPFRYCDVIFALLDKGCEGTKIKTGFPQTLTPETKFGKFLTEMGLQLTVGKTVDPEQALVGKLATFTTYNEKTQQGTFARIVQETIKYVPQKPGLGRVAASKEKLVSEFNKLGE